MANIYRSFVIYICIKNQSKYILWVWFFSLKKKVVFVHFWKWVDEFTLICVLNLLMVERNNYKNGIIIAVSNLIKLIKPMKNNFCYETISKISKRTVIFMENIKNFYLFKYSARQKGIAISLKQTTWKKYNLIKIHFICLPWKCKHFVERSKKKT